MREFCELSVDLIDESDNIRRSFSDEKLQELSASIRQHGILKPLLVRPNGERFLLSASGMSTRTRPGRR